jgi:hypothetical protein
MPPPANVHEVRQFLGLCNFFRCHVQNFTQLTAPLTALTKKECSWKGGTLPSDALTAFRDLQTYLCSEPIIDYTRRDRPYSLIADASLGDEKKPGGLGAILMQLNKNGDTASSHTPVGIFRSTSVTTRPSSWRCKLQFGVWNTLQLISEARSLRYTWTTDL